MTERKSPEELAGLEISNGIVNMTVTLCQIYGNFMDMPTAKEKVAEFLTELATSVRDTADIQEQTKKDQYESYLNFNKDPK